MNVPKELLMAVYNKLDNNATLSTMVYTEGSAPPEDPLVIVNLPIITSTETLDGFRIYRGAFDVRVHTMHQPGAVSLTEPYELQQEVIDTIGAEVTLDSGLGVRLEEPDTNPSKYEQEGRQAVDMVISYFDNLISGKYR